MKRRVKRCLTALFATTLVCGGTGSAWAVYEWDYYPPAICQSTSSDPSSARYYATQLENQSSGSVDYVCPMTTRSGNDWHYDDIEVVTRDQSLQEHIECRPWSIGDSSSGALFKPIKKSGSSAGARGALTIQWIDAFDSDQWQHRRVEVWCRVPARDTPSAPYSGLIQLIGERDD